MVVLSLALIVIYVLLYYVKWKNLIEWLEKKTNISKIDVNSWAEIKIVVKSWENKINIIPEKITWVQNTDITKTWNIINLSWSASWYWFLNNKTSTGNINLLSWTYIYYKTLESIEKLWIKYKYILTDDKNIYYIFLWTGNIAYSFSDIVNKLWWSLYEIKTEQEIIKNKLFGNKVIYINLTEYKNKLVLMLIEYWNENWIIQIDYENYYKSKNYLQGLFQ